MLTELSIENMGVIEHTILSFGDGMTALTGETGAGKTMLVEAIELLVGGRADPSIVRSGAREARVDGRLVVFAGGDLKEIVLSRVVPADGRSRAYVNGRPATAARLAELTSGHIDLHGQHAHQGLLSTQTQRAALDEFGQIDLTELRDAQARVTEIEAERAALGGDERARAREIDLLRFQVNELDAAAIDDDQEEAVLAREEALLADAVAHREAAATSLDGLRGDDGAAETMRTALRALAGRPPFDHIRARVAGLSAEIDDVVAELRALAETIEEDPERLDEIRVRRQLLTDLKRKYGDDLSEILQFHTDTRRRLHELESYDRRASELDQTLSDALEVERAAATDVRRQRSIAAPKLAAAVEARLHDLAMPHASIVVDVGGTNDDGPGDDVRFLLAANPGSPVLPLNRVASGGELARAMLALRLVLSDASGRTSENGSLTLVFDEVDAGIGGAAASAVGSALADLGEHHQVLVVTHLPQVAAGATCQMVVDKTIRNGETFANVAAVEGSDRVAEIARMLAGSDSDAALEHAKHLLA
jgi:DNA repair protein RecN (Recombination protein N)